MAIRVINKIYPPTFFRIKEEPLPFPLFKRVLQKNVSVVDVPINMKDWSPVVRAKIEGYDVFYDLMYSPFVLALDNRRHVIDVDKTMEVLDDL